MVKISYSEIDKFQTHAKASKAAAAFESDYLMRKMESTKVQ